MKSQTSRNHKISILQKIIILNTLLVGVLGAQTYSIRGSIAEAENKEALPSANIVLVDLADSTRYGAASNQDGFFHFSGLQTGKYLLTIRYLGYRSHEQKIELRSSIDLQNILLQPIALPGKEILVTAPAPAVIIKEDTTEYRADAYKVTRDAMAQDLIDKLPAVQVEDGKVQAQGEEVKKVLLDGRPFFGDDPNATLRNIPAEIIEKIQIFDQQSEQAQFTGFDDGNSVKTINLITRVAFRQGKFGKVNTGYGSEDRYVAGGNINRFDQEQRLTLLGHINNINEQNFSSADLLGITAQSSGRRAMTRPGGGAGSSRIAGPPPGGSPIGGSDRGGQAADFLVNARGGMNETVAAGVNFQDQWNKQIDFTGSYFFNSAENQSSNSLERTFLFSQSGEQIYKENNLSTSRNTNHRFNSRVEPRFDENNSLLFAPRLTVQLNDGCSESFGRTDVGGTNLNTVRNRFASDLSAIDASARLLLRHRFAQAGRTLSLNSDLTYSAQKGDNQLDAVGSYLEPTVQADTLDQFADLDRHGYGINSRIVFTEPLGTKSQLEIHASHSYARDESDLATWSAANQTTAIFDSTLSSRFNKVYRTVNVGTGYSYRRDQLNLTATIAYETARLNNDAILPHATTTDRAFSSLLPGLRLRYRLADQQNLMVDYRTRTKDPDIRHLQDVVDNSDPLQLTTGNPDLNPDYSHSLSLRFNRMNPSRDNFFFLMLGATITHNYIGWQTIDTGENATVYNSILINPGSQLRFPENMDGYRSLRSLLTYGFPLKSLRSTLSFNVNLNTTQTPSRINNRPNRNTNHSAGLGVVLSSNISEKLDFAISTQGNFHRSQYTIASRSGSSTADYFSSRNRANLNWQTLKGLIIRIVGEYRYDGNLDQHEDPHSIICTAAIGKKVGKNERGELRITAHDLLNQNTEVRRSITDSTIQDTSTEALGRYFLASFITDLRLF
ncbi:MAG TPA: outer membrane beta-barrel protein [bacterium]|nr:outer membrane beta-barrel protein [bacterium]